MQEKPLPRCFRHAAPSYMRHFSATPGDEHQLSATIETYRLEEFCCGRENQRSLWFYIHESESTDFVLVKAFTDLCMFLREARAAGVVSETSNRHSESGNQPLPPTPYAADAAQDR